MIPTLLLFAALLSCLASCSLFNQDLPNEPPKLQQSVADTTRVNRGGTVNLKVRATDEDDDPLSYHWTSFGEGSFRDSTSGTTSWIAPDQINGSSELFLLSLTVSDHQPETEDLTETFLIEVVQRPPSLTVIADTTISFSAPFAEVEAVGADPEQDKLEYRWEQLDGPVHVEPVSDRLDNEHSRLRFIPILPGDYRFAAQVGDGADTATAEVLVRVPAPPELPATGIVPRQLSRADGSVHRFEIDMYEYPNQRGTRPSLTSSFFRAVEVCATQGRRLCRAEEWRSACQGADLRNYSSSDDPAAQGPDFGQRFCNTVGSQAAGPAPDADFLTDYLARSGTFANCGTEGVYDLTGNVAEWVWTDSSQTAATYTLSSVLAARQCGEFAEPLPALPVDFDFSSRAINDLGTEYQDYLNSNRGFRCCRP
ncbi:MAG: SUMF1/EgtB/PvdO family nonheme iron enzyme [Candidatus Latescibacteria bacterium]|nr:SUMF1/EgtB/PvdO family nonheme iron enzyme [Candidatus Latescibacterota bacterium]